MGTLEYYLISVNKESFSRTVVQFSDDLEGLKAIRDGLLNANSKDFDYFVTQRVH